jgi:hypothetical protein
MVLEAAYGIWLCALYMSFPCIFVIVGKIPADTSENFIFVVPVTLCDKRYDF